MFDPGAEQLQHPPRPRTDIEEVGNLIFRCHLKKGRLDSLLRYMKGADFPPVSGIFAEIFFSGDIAGLLDCLQTFKVAGDDRVGLGHQIHEGPGQERRTALGREPVIDPASLLITIQQSGIAQQFQMT